MRTSLRTGNQDRLTENIGKSWVGREQHGTARADLETSIGSETEAGELVTANFITMGPFLQI
jgi:hypothetical protein